MSGNEKKLLVPRLRFPEYRAEDGWGSEFGNMIFDQISNKDHNSDLPVLAITQEQGAIPREMIDYHVSVTDKSLESYKVVEVGDFIISLRSFQGGIEFSRYRGICSPAYVILRLRHGHSEDYFRHYLKTDRFIAQMIKNLEGLRDGKMISYKQFSELELPIPPRDEQQKIADCLSSLDDLIAAESQKLDTLKTHKKGLMQQLFPREGETVPRLRFTEFRNAEDWKEWKVGELGDVITGNTPSTSKPQYYEGEYNFVSPADISDQRFIESTKTTLSKLGFEQTRQIPTGSVLFVCIGSTIGKVAQNMHLCATNQQINSLVPFSSFSGDFIYYLLLRESNRIAELAGNQAVPIINKSTFSDVSVRCPQEKEEQERVAGYLGTLDDLIYAQSQKIDALKIHKKGLMQQLFPTLDEVGA